MTCHNSTAVHRIFTSPIYLHQRGSLHNMRLSRVLRMLTLLVGLCRALGAPRVSQKPGEVPPAQLKMLALGLGHMLQGVEENVQRLEQQAELVGAEVDGASEGLEGLRKQSLQTGQIHRQVRKELQIQSTRRDRLQRDVTDLQKELEDLGSEQRAMQHQMSRIIQTVKSLTEPRGHTQSDASFNKVVIDKQARQLAQLNSEVLTQERIINRHLQLIQHLEKHLSSGV